MGQWVSEHHFVNRLRPGFTVEQYERDVTQWETMTKSVVKKRG
jgi:hypothetical protein